ncbi:polyisoprenoid-binding protein YceI [Aquimarina sp. MAR_2010_214]|uniref:YceI family protein n=1 Tax=Aquimarina sp. MAR_2010_214 TaxID=1250026 RepID=UPI000C705042|nr:YceI family protein [Aquimarina sp. MAR_2010_214]PKV52347.1 polyisoprenoid-binding protein YceI [Aquimarina sp. MAR_2010_214]
MKIKLIGTLAITVLLIATYSCKGEKQNETEASSAEEVKEAPTEAIKYNVDVASSSIHWTGSKPTGKHSGTLSLANGTFEAKEGKVMSGSFVIDMTSINVTDLEGDEKTELEGHLKGETEETEDHFFNIAKFPKAAFEITGISEKEGKTYIEGNLTLKDIKKNISFPATTSVEGNIMTLDTEVFTINRTDWSVNYASKSVFGDLGDRFINDDIEIKINIKANKS